MTPPRYKKTRHGRRYVQGEATEETSPGAIIIGFFSLIALFAMGAAALQSGAPARLHTPLPEPPAGVPPENYHVVGAPDSVDFAAGIGPVFGGVFILAAVIGVFYLLNMVFGGGGMSQNTVHYSETITTEPKAEEPDIAARLQKLDELLKKELVSREEYDSKRADLLARL